MISTIVFAALGFLSCCGVYSMTSERLDVFVFAIVTEFLLEIVAAGSIATWLTLAAGFPMPPKPPMPPKFEQKTTKGGK